MIRKVSFKCINWNQEGVGQLTIDLIQSGDDMSKFMNEYFLSFFTEDDYNLTTIQEIIQLYEGEENDKLRDMIIT